MRYFFAVIATLQLLSPILAQVVHPAISKRLNDQIQQRKANLVTAY
jgi:hypothetical protein